MSQLILGIAYGKVHVGDIVAYDRQRKGSEIGYSRCFIQTGYTTPTPHLFCSVRKLQVHRLLQAPVETITCHKQFGAALRLGGHSNDEGGARANGVSWAPTFCWQRPDIEKRYSAYYGLRGSSKPSKSLCLDSRNPTSAYM